MIRRSLPIFFAAALVFGFIWTLIFLYRKSVAAPVIYQTATVTRGDVIEKTIAPGAIVPRREVAIKPRVSGVVEHLFVVPGDYIKAGAEIAKIKIIPNVVTLNASEARLATAKINLASSQKQYERFKRLSGMQLVDQSEFIRSELEFNLAKQEVADADSNLQLVREGAERGTAKVSNVVTSTVEGTVLEVPIREGSSVIESNTFNEGTTVASVADMNDMLFQGHVDESEVGALSRGMVTTVTVGALRKERFTGRLEYISPKGTDKDGAIEFEVRAAIELKPGAFLRANYGANADIILDRRDNVPLLRESLVTFDHGQPYVEVEVSPQVFERRSVVLGLSDGFNVEIVSGLNANDHIKVIDSRTSAQKPAP